MKTVQGSYAVERLNRNEQNLLYFFISQGKEDIVKSIEYSYSEEETNGPVYNLGFTTVNLEKGTISDDELSANGDHYPVLNTVLSTIPMFFETFKGAVLKVEGSDSRPTFIAECQQDCTRKCEPAVCKKAHRRINIYNRYIDKHYAELSQEYDFWGTPKDCDEQDMREDYQLNRDYKRLFLKKKW
jgi:hypothetical protein